MKAKPKKNPEGKPRHIRATSAMAEERTQVIADLLAQHANKHHIKRLVKQMHKRELENGVAKPLWDVGWRQIEDYIARAREVLFRETDKTRAQARRESIAYYENFIATGKGTPRDRILAQERLDKIYGVEIHRIEMSGPGGAPVPVADKTPAPNLNKAKIAALIALGEGVLNATDKA